MSTRRSARLEAVVPTASAAYQSEEQPDDGNVEAEDDYEEEEDVQGDDVNDDEDDEFASRKPKRRKIDAGESSRPARRKTATGTKASGPAKKKAAAARGRVKGRLQSFMELPLDVIFEILFCVHYPDLISLVRASKRIWKILREPAHNTLWKAARADVPDSPVPDPPSDMSEVNWAYLLYGGSGCYSCGAKNVQTILFGLKRRACTRCKKAFMIWNVYGGGGKILLDKISSLPFTLVKNLLNYSEKDSQQQGYRQSEPGYWKTDAEDLKRHVSKLQSAGGEDAVKAFIERRKTQVREDMQAVKSLEKWDAKRKDQATERRDAIRQENSKKLHSRLLAAGYDSRDILEVSKKESIFGKKELRTEKALSSVQAEMEPLVITARDKRLDSEAADRRAARTRKAVWLYHQYLKTLLPVQWRYLPRADLSDDNGVRLVPCFKRLIEDARVDIPEAEWTAAVDELLQSLSELLVSSLSVLEPRLSDDLPEFPASFELAPQGKKLEPAALDALCRRFSLLDLVQVTAHFTLRCAEYDRWRPKPTGGPSRHIIMRVISSLAQLAGLGSVATPRELDIACGDVWFRCADCLADSNASWSKYAYLGWQSFLQHCARQPERSHKPELMPAGYAPDDDTPPCKDWSCMHCSALGTSLASTDSDYAFLHPDSSDKDSFLDMRKPAKCFWNAVTLGEVQEHVKTKHGIENPRKHYDYFHIAKPQDLCETMTVKAYYTPEAA